MLGERLGLVASMPLHAIPVVAAFYFIFFFFSRGMADGKKTDTTSWSDLAAWFSDILLRVMASSEQRTALKRNMKCSS